MRKTVFICRLLFDRRAAGIHRYALEILKELDKIASDQEIEVLIPATEEDSYHFEHIKVVKLGSRIQLPGKNGNRIEGYLYKNFHAFRYVRKNNALSADLLLQFPLFGCDIIAIYDCRVNLFPELYNFTRNQKHVRKAMLRHQNRAVKHCQKIITDSNTIKQELGSIYPEAEKQTTVAYCGWQHFKKVVEDDRILDKWKLKDREYYFSLGSSFPHKNQKWLLHAAEQNPDKMFVISGKDVGDQSLKKTVQQNVIFAGRLSDGEIKALMRHCKAFIQPSLYEGFGIPPLEAMSVGADCILSDIPVFREVYKNSVWYMDPNDYEHIDLDKIMSAPKEANDVILNEYSWKKSARELLDVIRELAGEPDPADCGHA